MSNASCRLICVVLAMLAILGGIAAMHVSIKQLASYRPTEFEIARAQLGFVIGAILFGSSIVSLAPINRQLATGFAVLAIAMGIGGMSLSLMYIDSPGRVDFASGQAGVLAGAVLFGCGLISLSRVVARQAGSRGGWESEKRE